MNPVHFCNYATREQAQSVAAMLNELAEQMRLLRESQPAHLRASFGYGIMNCGLYDYSAGDPLKCHKDITDAWGGLYRALRQEGT